MRRILAVVGAVLLTTMMAGCIGPEPGGRHKPSPSPTPVFASDEEALAAAEAAYGAYVTVSDQISSDGGSGSERLQSLVTKDEYARAVSQFDTFMASGKRTEGSTTFDSLALQRYDSLELAVYVCVDVSAVRLLDAEGHDVTPPDRPDRVPVEVTFAVNSHDELLLASSDVWNAGTNCAR